MNTLTKAMKNIALKVVFIIFCSTCFTNIAFAMENMSPVSLEEIAPQKSSTLKILCKLAPQLCR